FGWLVDSCFDLLALSSGASIGSGATFRQNIFSIGRGVGSENGDIYNYAVGFTSGTPAFVVFRFDSGNKTRMSGASVRREVVEL
ncbi:MAG: hypothetical protein AAGH40_12420, partial [Verrucomicrobiota bacterium]